MWDAPCSPQYTATAAWLKKPTEKEKEIGHIILVYSICIYRRQKKIFCRYIPSIASHWCVSSTLGGCYFNYLVVLFYLLQLIMFKIWICMNSQKYFSYTYQLNLNSVDLIILFRDICQIYVKVLLLIHIMIHIRICNAYFWRP